MKTEATHIRKGHMIINRITGDKKKFGSINKAKKASHKIQMDADEGLGRGSLKIIPVK